MSERSATIFTAERAYDSRSPDLSGLTLEEIASSLARLYRWRGACPVSVAMHSVLMSRCARSKKVARAALIHDAHEIFVGDLSSNWKTYAWCAPYVKTEERLSEAMAARFGLDYPFPPEVRELDLRARASEVYAFMPHALETVEGLRPLSGITFKPAWSIEMSRKQFLRRAAELGLA